MDRDVPERRDVEVAHVLLLAIGRPAAIDVGQVVVRAARLALERPRRPHARERPAIELRRWRNDDRLRLGQRHDGLACGGTPRAPRPAPAPPRPACRARDAAPSPGATLRPGRRRSDDRRRFGTPPAPRASSRSAIASSRSALSVDAVLELQLLLEPLASQTERRLGARREIGLEIVDVRLDRRRGLGGGVGQVAEDVEVVETGERARQIRLDELQRRRARFRARP